MKKKNEPKAGSKSDKSKGKIEKVQFLLLPVAVKPLGHATIRTAARCSCFFYFLLFSSSFTCNIPRPPKRESEMGSLFSFSFLLFFSSSLFLSLPLTPWIPVSRALFTIPFTIRHSPAAIHFCRLPAVRLFLLFAFERFVAFK